MVSNLIRTYNNSRIVQIIIFTILNVFLVPVFFVFLLVSVFYNVRFIRLVDERIGEFCERTDSFLRKIQLKKVKSGGIQYVGVASDNPSNDQIMKMYKRKMKIIQVHKWLHANPFFRALSSQKSLLGYFKIFYEFPTVSNYYDEFVRGTPTLEFTNEEERQGQELLRKMGIGEGDWFVCLHARDEIFTKKTFDDDLSYHDYRNWSVKTALKAAEYITKKGGYVIRMGSHVKKGLDVKNKKIIDYASDFRTEFGDIYLAAKCKFFLGSNCGLTHVAQVFNTPVAWVNVIPIFHPPWSQRDLFIPKKIWSINDEKFLSFSQAKDLNLKFYQNKEYFKKGLKIVNNSEEDILKLVIEMYKILSGRGYSKKEDEMQYKFKSIFNREDNCYGFPSRIGVDFLMENKDLL
ncbi:TIGR04372 family glycosyltransferase [Nanoarchaeota archaeon]